MSNWDEDLKVVLNKLATATFDPALTKPGHFVSATLTSCIIELRALKKRYEAMYVCPNCGKTYIPSSPRVLDEMLLDYTNERNIRNKPVSALICQKYAIFKTLELNFADVDMDTVLRNRARDDGYGLEDQAVE